MWNRSSYISTLLYDHKDSLDSYSGVSSYFIFHIFNKEKGANMEMVELISQFPYFCIFFRSFNIYILKRVMMF